LQNFNDIGIRPGLIGWFVSYLQGRSQITSHHSVKSERMEINGGVPQGSKLGPIAFIIKTNQLPSVTNWELYGWGRNNNVYGRHDLIRSDRSIRSHLRDIDWKNSRKCTKKWN
jgi:hypothetical protein